MQAQPLSSPAARSPSTLSTPSRTPIPVSVLALSNPRNLLAGLLAPLAAPTTALADNAGLAHDAGNFLVALGLYCDLLSAPGILRPEHKHYADELSVISNASSKLIRRLLASSLAALPDSAESDRAKPVSPLVTVLNRRNTRSTDATTPPNHAFMLRCLSPVLKRIAAGAANVSVTCPGDLPALEFPSEIIERITVNLVRNAAEAIRNLRAENQNVLPFAEIRISLVVTGPHVQLTVEDNGPGMSPSMVEEFLHPSPLPSGAKRGLGHRIVQELAILSSGELTVDAPVGGGTLIRLKWPIPLPATIGSTNLRSVTVPSASPSSGSIEGPSAC